MDEIKTGSIYNATQITSHDPRSSVMKQSELHEEDTIDPGLGDLTRKGKLLVRGLKPNEDLNSKLDDISEIENEEERFMVMFFSDKKNKNLVTDLEGSKRGTKKNIN